MGVSTRLFARCSAALLLLSGCASKTPGRHPGPALSPVTFAVQAGAFRNAENAVRLARSLDQAGVEAFHFVGADGLYRVRFGTFPSRDSATRHAEALMDDAVIAGYHVVVSSARPGSSHVGVRGDIVRSAMSFLGRPYRWGGADSAFDCSGLTMTAYGLSGLSLPRSSAEQFSVGAPVGAERLQKGDLVFFAIEARDRPTHVGLYIGDGRFVHAPGRGKVVRADDLSDSYYRRHWLAGRSYLH
jgi:hypothetical protein